ncbi:MAG: hypothetical protein AAGF79_06245 [Pseudomonadota bacterium]
MQSDHRPAAPDYTNAALVMLGLNLFLVLFAIWSLFGYVTALLVAFALNHGLDRWAARRNPTGATAED